jgi:hypothetical protein
VTRSYPTLSLPHRDFRAADDAARHRGNVLEIERYLTLLDGRMAALEARPVRLYSAASNADLVLGTAVADVAACTVTFTTVSANATALVVGMVDCDITTAGTGFCNAYVNCSQGGTNDFACAFEDRVHREWGPVATSYTLTAAGTYTVKLRGNKNAAGGAAAIKINTRIVALVTG